LLRDEVMPQIDEAVEATRYAWERGRYSYLEWTEAQAERLALQRALVESAANAQIFQVEIERLTGSALEPELMRDSPGERP
jgi:cobalt-zinc-cadmium efflux system outer membrane protein